MRSAGRVLLLLGVLALASAYPTPLERNPEEGDKFEGDIMLSTEQRIAIQFGGRNGLISQELRWPDRKVFYKFFKNHHNEAQRNHILRGMQMLEEVSCIRFYPADETTTKYINITALPDGCYSNVGYMNDVQIVNFQVYELDTGCFRLATIMHEFLHSLGFYHQQSTYNRDDYVKIVEENIQENMQHNFNIYNNTVVDDFGVEYDYGSVMHYGPLAFSKNGKETIVPLQPDVVIGQRVKISEKDIYKLNIMYQCPIQL